MLAGVSITFTWPAFFAAIATVIFLVLWIRSSLKDWTSAGLFFLSLGICLYFLGVR